MSDDELIERMRTRIAALVALGYRRFLVMTVEDESELPVRVADWVAGLEPGGRG